MEHELGVVGVLIIGDGMGDRPIPELGDRTPLEAADTPNLDRLAGLGACGLMNSVGVGIRSGSDTSHLALLGYDPYKYYTGRGPYECAGIDMDVRGGDVCFRCNFSTVNADMVVLDRRAGRIERGTDQLAQAVNMEIEGVQCIVKESVAHRAGLILRGEGLGHRVTDVDPHGEGRIWECKALDADSEKTARVVNQFVRRSYEVLREHSVNRQRESAGELPANIMLPRGVGTAPHLRPFAEEHGFSGAMIVETGLVRGIGKYAQMDVIDVEGATGGYDTDILAMAEAVVEASERHAFVLCNVKAPDLAGHDNQPERKIEAVQMVDNLVSYVAENLDLERALLVVTADHGTPCSVGDHSGDAVPILFSGRGVTRDDVAHFGERPCGKGLIGHILGRDVIPLMTNMLAIQEKFGA